MYQALYRKYRPKTFEDVVGQEVIVRTLINSIRNDRLSHAYLFSGPRGTGKTTIAKILADLVNCENPVNDKKCQKCVYCTQSSKQNIDIIEIDAASNNGIDEIRELKNKVNLVPNIGRYKIYIIDEVHMLTIGAFNALLKTLEEPPAHVVFILATTDPHKIPTTILSRCQRFDFKKLTAKQLENRLKSISEEENVEIENLGLKEISRLADGGMRDAIGILDQVIAYANGPITLKDIHDVSGSVSISEIEDLITAIITAQIDSMIQQIESLDDNGKSIVKIVDEIIFYLRDLILEKYENKNEENLQKYIDLVEYLNQKINEIKQSSVPKISLEIVLIKFITDNNKVSNPIVNNKEIKGLKSDCTEEKNVDKVEDIVNKTKTIKPSQPVENYFREIKTKRIENTLAEVSKMKLTELRQKENEVRNYVLDEKYKPAAIILENSKMMAASDKNIIYSLRTEIQSNEFNENIEIIEKLVKKIYSQPFKIISTWDEDWLKIREEFKNKTKKYEYIEENNEMKDIFKKLKSLKENKGELETMFEGIIEYN